MSLNQRTSAHLPTHVSNQRAPVCVPLAKPLHQRLQLNCSPSRCTRKINSQTNQKGYDKSETTCGKLLARRIQICCVYFCVIDFWPLFFEITFLSNNYPTKLQTAKSDSPRRILLSKVSGPSGVPYFVRELFFSHFRKSSWCISAR